MVSASDVLARGHVSVADRRTSDGRPTNALFAVTRALRRALSFKQPDLAVAVVASPTPPGWPEDLRAQAEPLLALLDAHGLAVVHSEAPRHQVAAYTHAALEAGCDAVVVGCDKRLAQLVGPSVWWYDAVKDVRYTAELVRKRFDVGPAEVAGWLALVGDDDHLPGVRGIGKKGATSLIAAHGSLQAAIDAANEVAGRTGTALRAARDQARSELARATLDPSGPLPRPLSELAYTPPTVEALNEAYRGVELYELLAAEQAEQRFAVCATPDAVRAVVAGLGTGPVALHALIEDPSPPRGALVGLALSAEPGAAVYVPASDTALAALKPFLEDPDRPVVGHDLKAAIVALARRGVAVRGVTGDSALASHLEDPSGRAPHDLHKVARVRLQRALQPEEAIRGTGARQRAWGDLEVGRAGAYACHLAECARALWDVVGPGAPADLLAEHLALSDTLVRMELAGMPCDADDLARSGADFARIGAELEAEIVALAGRSFSIGSPKQLGQVLYAELELPVLARTKTGWSTATSVLERLVHAHPIVPLVIRWRQLRRLQDSWVTALTRAIGPDGRIHSTFHPARSFSGRLVNSQPDLGRVPGRTPELARIRQAFRARPGWTLLSVDYDQLGLYVLAHLTGDPALTEPLASGADVHVATAAAVLEVAPEEVDTERRQVGKVVNFATFAGQGSSALALQLGVSAREAKQLIARFDVRYAGVRAFQAEQLRLAREVGYVTTLAGRRWRIGDLDSRELRDRAYAERLARRATHEGSVADVTRRGLLRADQSLVAAGSEAVPLVQIHDEVLFEVPDGELAAVAELAAEAMRGAFALRVPLRVGCKAGPSWAELTPLS